MKDVKVLIDSQLSGILCDLSKSQHLQFLTFAKESHFLSSGP